MSQEALRARALATGPDLMRWGFLILGVLYSAGLLIVNIDLGRYGLVTLDLARVEYVSAGALWALLTIATAAAIGGFWDVIKSWRSGPFVFWRAFLAVVGLTLLLEMLSLGEIQLSRPEGFSVLIGLAASTYSLQRAGFSIAQLIRGPDWKMEDLFSGGNKQAFPPVYWIMLALAGFVMYGSAVYPKFPREVGGGKRPAVQLVLVRNNDTTWSSLGLPEPKGDGRIGPVLLLLETAGTLFVLPGEGPPAESWLDELFPTAKSRSAVAIDKRLISGLVYVGRAWRGR